MTRDAFRGDGPDPCHKLRLMQWKEEGTWYTTTKCTMMRLPVSFPISCTCPVGKYPYVATVNICKNNQCTYCISNFIATRILLFFALFCNVLEYLRVLHVQLFHYEFYRLASHICKWMFTECLCVYVPVENFF